MGDRECHHRDIMEDREHRHQDITEVEDVFRLSFQLLQHLLL
jgi:hypothetical protein